jgi:hypothetical protein
MSLLAGSLVSSDHEGAGMNAKPIALKVLLQQRHLQGHRAFCREYDKVATELDKTLAGS